jgi:hypothetical protein
MSIGKTGHVLVRTPHSRGQPKGQRFQSSKSAMSGGLNLGRCCGSKPIEYKRPAHLFCSGCCRSYDVETKFQQENWAWVRDGEGFRPTYPTHVLASGAGAAGVLGLKSVRQRLSRQPSIFVRPAG